MSKSSRFAFVVLSMMAIAELVGCGGQDEWSAKRPPVFKASGVVTMDGKPVEEATVIYYSQAHDLSAQGMTDQEGRFKLTTYKESDGAVEGKHKVTVTKRTYEKKKTKFDSAEESSVALIPKDVLPTRYSMPTTTTLEVEVSSKGANNSTIEIPAK